MFGRGGPDPRCGPSIASGPRPGRDSPRCHTRQPHADAGWNAGCAHGFWTGQGEDIELTSSRAGGLLGTLRYAAPEQLAAATLKVTPSADVRGLGVTLWELLTRERLFADADEKQLAARVFDSDVPRLRSIDKSFDPDLEAIVARAAGRSSDRIATPGAARTICNSTSTANRCRSGRQRRADRWAVDP